MRCPACFNELTQTQVGSLRVDVCQGGCGGIWFDAFELQRVDEEEEAAGEPLLQIERDPKSKWIPQRKRVARAVQRCACTDTFSARNGR